MKNRMAVRFLCLLTVLLTIAAVPAAGPAEDTAGQVFVDLDLSVMSGTVVYAQVYNMMYEPESYLGRVIRIAGYYNAFADKDRGIVYHACIVPDATACCAQGIEFVLAGEHSWPEDYPEDGTDIVVTGRLELYEEDGRQYLHLVDSDLVWEKGDDQM
jgi:hypothetical protein